MSKKSLLSLWIAIIVLAVGGAWFVLRGHGQPANLDSFAQCLAQKGATMYGAYWCSVCKEEKQLFGDSFRFVPYVECTAEPKKCLDAGINGYPTWIFPDGRKLEGFQGIEGLSRESGCPFTP
jgi:hypothetical protein